MRRLLLISSAVALASGAVWVYSSTSTKEQAPEFKPVGVEPDELDGFGEPEPSFSWFDWGTYSEMFNNVTGETVTAGQQETRLNYFRESEFGQWWPLMDADLLQKLDAFRAGWGRPVQVSPANGALGRHAGDSGSYHNIDKWGAVRAVDVFPDGLTADNAAAAVELAERVGLGGIGVYTDTRPSMMMHLDNRTTAGRWSRVNGEYLAIGAAYV